MKDKSTSRRQLRRLNVQSAIKAWFRHHMAHYTAKIALPVPAKSVLSTLARVPLDRREMYNLAVAKLSSELENQDGIEQKVASHLNQQEVKGE